MNKRASRLITTLAALGIGLVAMALVPAVFQRAWVYANPGPDLIVESITISPAAPELSQTVYITVVTRNMGNVADHRDRRVQHRALYRPSRPAADLHHQGLLPLHLGHGGCCPATMVTTPAPHVFTTTGCNHVVYAWADAGQTVAEDNESNNVTLRHHLRRRPGRGRQLRARQHLRRLPLGHQHPGPLPPGPYPVAPGRRRLASNSAPSPASATPSRPPTWRPTPTPSSIS